MNNPFVSTSVSMTPWQMLLNVFLAALLGMCLSVVYRKSHTGFSYSQSINYSIVVTAVIVSGIIMAIGENIVLSLGLVGSLSIIRYRMAVKDSRDISFMFASILVGLAMGTSAYWIVVIVISIFIFITFFMWRWGGAMDTDSDYLLLFKASPKSKVEMEVLPNIQPFTKTIKLKSIHELSTGQVEFVFGVSLPSGMTGIELSQIVREIDGIEAVNLISPESRLAI